MMEEGRKMDIFIMAVAYFCALLTVSVGPLSLRVKVDHNYIDNFHL